MSVLHDFAFVSFFYIQKFKRNNWNRSKKKFFKKYLKKFLLLKNWVHPRFILKKRKKTFCDQGGFRTHRPLIQSPALYQLNQLGYVEISTYFIEYILKKQPKLDSQDKYLIISKTTLNFFKSFLGIVWATSMVEWTPSAECGHKICSK